MGFDALYMTGYGTVASHLGLPDAGLASYADMVGRVESWRGWPRAADRRRGHRLRRPPQRPPHRSGLRARRGRGDPARGPGVSQEMRSYAGPAGRRSRRHGPKIAVATEARTNPDFLIVARTDARSSLGLAEAIRRARAYAKAGADLLFVELPETEEEMIAIGRQLGDMPLVANMVEGGRTPMLSSARLAEIGYALAIFPVSASQRRGGAERCLPQIRETGSSPVRPRPLSLRRDEPADGLRGGMGVRQSPRRELRSRGGERP